MTASTPGCSRGLTGDVDNIAMSSHPPTLTIARAPFLENERLLSDVADLASHSPTAPQRAIARDLCWTLTPHADDENATTEADLDSALDDAAALPASTTWGDLDSSIFSPVVDSPEEIARLLLPGGMAELPTNSDEYVVFIPNTEMAIVVPSDNAVAISRAAQMVEFYSNPTTRISLLPIVGSDGQWRSYQPSPDHLAYDAYHRLSVLDRAEVANSQGEMLLHVARPELHVAPLLTMQVGGSLQTVCTWSAATEALLPQADIVGLTDHHGELLLLALWEAVERVAGHHLLATGHKPHRWQTVGFPNERELDVLEMVRLRIHY